MTREQARERAKKVAGAFYEAICSMREADKIDAIAKLMLFERAEQAEEDSAFGCCAVCDATKKRASELRQATKGE